MDYNFNEIEQRWQRYWEAEGVYKADEASDKPPFYVLDMFPYPSGAGLHVGHPLGYIASDIVARFKRHKGFEVLHPMGYDAFGLPAEQYAIDTGNHPAEFTERNIDRYREQLKMIGLSFDWSRELKTSDPKYYKWTQWIFIQLFNSWYDTEADKAKDIGALTGIFSAEGNANVKAAHHYKGRFTAGEWNAYGEEEKQKILLDYRMAYLANSEVNWCPELGTVLANEEVKDGFSERGGYPVVKKTMQQWFLRITAYSDKLLRGLDTIDWPEPLKEMQRNWIGKSVGAEVEFKVKFQRTKHKEQIPNSSEDMNGVITVFTTRPDTIFGATFMVLAPEHALVKEITTNAQKEEIEAYTEQAKRKSERERMTETKKISGAFTGTYAINPFTGNEMPVWIADYVLADYGSGAIMAVPGHDSRDWAFAKHFGLPIVEVVKGGNVQEASHDAKDGELVNSGFLDGLQVPKAIERAIEEITKKDIGKKQINYRLRDANFARQRYWGEPIPIVYRGGLPYPLPLEELPVILPDVKSYKPTGTGESPLAALTDWVNMPDGSKRETNTMPGWAGAAWYFLRYMDPHNEKEFLSKEREQYWKNVDFYLGGSEHATGHLLYSRFWHKFLNDRNFISTDEPFKKLINQGMIQGRSSLLNFLGYSTTVSGDEFREIKAPMIYISHDIAERFKSNSLLQSDITLIENAKKQLNSKHIRFIDIIETRNVEIDCVENDILNIEKFKTKPRLYRENSVFINEPKLGKLLCGVQIEKMGKSKYNVITPDEMVTKYGCDAFRMYEMFLGPLEQSKPWNTEGIDGVSRFLKKLWNLFASGNSIEVSNEDPTSEELKILHKTIKKVSEDIERLNLNTCISSFMICVNELGALKCNKRIILEPLIILISPFAPHIAEELWAGIGNKGSVTCQPYPEHKEEYLVESKFEYPVSINGKLRGKLLLDLSLTKEQVEQEVLKMEEVAKWSNGQLPKKIIVVPGRIVNVVV
jgi:leucyl-tRNA synthetase